MYSSVYTLTSHRFRVDEKGFSSFESGPSNYIMESLISNDRFFGSRLSSHKGQVTGNVDVVCTGNRSWKCVLSIDFGHAVRSTGGLYCTIHKFTISKI